MPNFDGFDEELHGEAALSSSFLCPISFLCLLFDHGSFLATLGGCKEDFHGETGACGLDPALLPTLSSDRGPFSSTFPGGLNDEPHGEGVVCPSDFDCTPNLPLTLFFEKGSFFPNLGIPIILFCEKGSLFPNFGLPFTLFCEKGSFFPNFGEVHGEPDIDSFIFDAIPPLTLLVDHGLFFSSFGAGFTEAPNGEPGPFISDLAPSLVAESSLFDVNEELHGEADICPSAFVPSSTFALLGGQNLSFPIFIEEFKEGNAFTAAFDFGSFVSVLAEGKIFFPAVGGCFNEELQGETGPAPSNLDIVWPFTLSGDHADFCSTLGDCLNEDFQDNVGAC